MRNGHEKYARAHLARLGLADLLLRHTGQRAQVKRGASEEVFGGRQWTSAGRPVDGRPAQSLMGEITMRGGDLDLGPQLTQ